jgi:hypothetical protein
MRYDGSSWGSSERADSLSAYMAGGKTLQACQRSSGGDSHPKNAEHTRKSMSFVALCSLHIVVVFLHVSLYGASYILCGFFQIKIFVSFILFPCILQFLPV